MEKLIINRKEIIEDIINKKETSEQNINLKFLDWID